jgi:hypothetical protein
MEDDQRRSRMTSRVKTLLGAAGVALALALAPAAAQAAPEAFLLAHTTHNEITSTVPANGDQNPYGVAVVPRSVGDLVAGDVLVSNFNDAANQQGTGTTIVQVDPQARTQQVFAQLARNELHGACPGGLGLTTALAVLRNGWVIVGSLPATYNAKGVATSLGAGCLIVLDSAGHAVETIAGGPIDGPWDLAAQDDGDGAVLFVANVLNGLQAHTPADTPVDRGTVVRLVLDTAAGVRPVVTSETVIGSGFPEETDPAALVIGPTGLALAPDGTLYVADSIDNRIAKILDATGPVANPGTGVTVAKGAPLNDPLGMALAPNGDILTANGNDGLLVETSPDGSTAPTTLDTGFGGGSLFGIALSGDGDELYLVNDGNNTLNVLQ